MEHLQILAISISQLALPTSLLRYIALQHLNKCWVFLDEILKRGIFVAQLFGSLRKGFKLPFEIGCFLVSSM